VPSNPTALRNGKVPVTNTVPSSEFSEDTYRPPGYRGEEDVTSRGPLDTMS
jgi:hypothetical protein